MKARRDVIQDLLEKAGLAPLWWPRAERPVLTFLTGARQAHRRHEHIATGDDRLDQGMVLHHGRSRGTGAMKVDHHWSRGHTVVPWWGGGEIGA